MFKIDKLEVKVKEKQEYWKRNWLILYTYGRIVSKTSLVSIIEYLYFIKKKKFISKLTNNWKKSKDGNYYNKLE